MECVQTVYFGACFIHKYIPHSIRIMNRAWEKMNSQISTLCEIMMYFSTQTLRWRQNCFILIECNHQQNNTLLDPWTVDGTTHDQPCMLYLLRSSQDYIGQKNKKIIWSKSSLVRSRFWTNWQGTSGLEIHKFWGEIPIKIRGIQWTFSPMRLRLGIL